MITHAGTCRPRSTTFSKGCPCESIHRSTVAFARLTCLSSHSPDDYFDLIHCRDGGFATFMESNRIDMLSEIARALKPGGVVSFETLQVSVISYSLSSDCPRID